VCVIPSLNQVTLGKTPLHLY